MKTGRDWFNGFEDKELGQKAIAVSEFQGRGKYLDIIYDTPSRALDRCITWGGTNEGQHYWSNIYNKLVQTKIV